MSTQRGNTQRSRPQKHKNKTSFKNNLHDTSNRTKLINNIHVSDVCLRCKDIIEWKIKYKKYKPLSQPKKCVNCEQKTVRKAYHVMCTECGKLKGVCTKCCQSKEVATSKPDIQEQNKLDNEMKSMLQSLPERKRRTFLRYISKLKQETTSEDKNEKLKKDLKNKFSALKLADDDGLSDDDFDDSDLDQYDSDNVSED